MTLATILFCLVGQPTNCPVRHQFRLEPGACNAIAALGPRKAEVPVNGEWKPALVRVRCG